MSLINPTVLIIMGVSGSGKTTIGKLLAERLEWRFADADSFHPPENVAKMAAGTPLNETDRAPWLESLRGLIAAWLAAETPGILACSALRQTYREKLSVAPAVRFIHLAGSYELIEKRLSHRTGHYFNPALLKSQFDALEAPSAGEDFLELDISKPPEVLVQQTVDALGL